MTHRSSGVFPNWTDGQFDTLPAAHPAWRFTYVPVPCRTRPSRRQTTRRWPGHCPRRMIGGGSSGSPVRTRSAPRARRSPASPDACALPGQAPRRFERIGACNMPSIRLSPPSRCASRNAATLAHILFCGFLIPDSQDDSVSRPIPSIRASSRWRMALAPTRRGGACPRQQLGDGSLMRSRGPRGSGFRLCPCPGQA